MTMITGEAGIKFAQAAAIKGSLRLFKVGMGHSRFSGKDMLANASVITGKSYKRGQYDAAIKDLEAWMAPQMAPAK